MVNIDKQVEHWRVGAEEDLAVALQLVSQGTIRHGLFFAHLSLEKILKAHICQTTNNLAPQTHNLSRLAAIADLSLTDVNRDLLAIVNGYNIEGRYPALFLPLPSPAEAAEKMKNIQELFEWLKQKF